MKFPVATTALVSAALLFVLWQQTREQPQQPDDNRFQNFSSQPVERSAVVDWVVGQLPTLCEDATGTQSGSQKHDECMEQTRSVEPNCRRLAAADYPSTVTSETVFRDLSTTMMECMVRQARPVGG